MSQSLDLLKVLEDLDVLRSLPMTLLNMVVTYICIGPIKGRFVASFAAKERGYDQLHRPTSIACSTTTEELFVVDRGNHRVQVFSLADVRYLRTLGTEGYEQGEFNDPYGVCVDEETGHVFVADGGNNRVQEFRLDGTFVRIIGRERGKSHSQPGQLSFPYGLSIDSRSRLIYISEWGNNRISVFSLEDGQFVRCFGSQGSGDTQFYHPMGLHFDEERKLLVIADGSNHRVKVVRPDGSLVRMLGLGSCGSGDHQLAYPCDVTVDSRGEVLVSDFRNHRIQIFCVSTGKQLRKFDHREAGNGKLRSPISVWWNTCSGRLYVVDYANIHVFE